MKLFFRKKNRDRYNAIQDIKGYVVKTSLSSFPQTTFKVYGLTGPETCHRLDVTHTHASPYTITHVSLQDNLKNSRPVQIQFQWRGPHIDRVCVNATAKAIEHFFPEEKR